LRKRRSVILGVFAAAVVAAIVGTLGHIVAVAGAGTALTICLVGLGPALAAVALVTAVGAVAPPMPGSIAVTSPGVETPAETQI
jgi:hypothetical protein